MNTQLKNEVDNSTNTNQDTNELKGLTKEEAIGIAKIIGRG